MQVITQDELMVRKDEIFERIKDGAIFIYPTDTIYGIGCHAGNKESVQKIRDIKGRISNPFSVIAPSKEWIRENCAGVDLQKAQEWIEKLPGPYTLILNLRMHNVVCQETNAGLSTLGVRIPDHWFSAMVHEVDVPIITTSANRQGEDFMTSLENLDPEVKKHVDFIIYEEEKHGSPSTIVNLTLDELEIIER